MKSTYLYMLLLLVLMSCGTDQEAADLTEIEQFIVDNNIRDVEVTEDGIYYSINTPGSEEKPKITDRVTIHYEGYYTDGVIFDSSVARGEPLTIEIANTIVGWRRAIPLFGKGGSGIIIIPSRFAYGPDPDPRTGIRSNAVLVFEIDLIDFE